MTLWERKCGREVEGQASRHTLGGGRLGAFLCGLLLFLGVGAVSPLWSSEERQGESLAESSVRWLREYMQIETSNPPGQEAEAARFLAAILRREGIEHHLLESAPGRTSLLGRIPGRTATEGALVLMHHIDVVPAGVDWRQDPLSGRRVDGDLWGRGAVDVKSLGIAQLLALVRLAREGEVPERDIVFLAVADEEAGGGMGAAWILEHSEDVLGQVWAVLNEGGSNRVIGGRLAWWGIEVAQKRPLWLRLTTSGGSGHASGHHPASANHRLIRALARLLQKRPEYRVTGEVKRYLEAIAEREQAGPEHIFRRLDSVVASGNVESLLPAGMAKYFLDSLQVTVLEAGTGVNVVAAEASALVDIRMLPDTDEEALLEDLRDLLGADVEVEVLVNTPPSAPSSTDHALFRILRQTLGVRGPVLPTFLAGATDSRFFRQRNIPAYGFSPFALQGESLRGIHARDEHIPEDAFLRGVEMLYRVVKAATR